MLGLLARPFTASEIVTLALMLVLLVLVAIIAVQTWRQSRVPPEEIERRRRLSLSAKGKMGDATLLDIRDSVVYYSYDVRGVGYTATQDISALTEQLPPELAPLIGPIYVKYDPNNPANSIVVSEDWSGLRMLHPRT